MKRVLFLFNVTLSLLITSCVSLDQMTVTEVIDYSRFLKNGIYVTESNNVDFDYIHLYFSFISPRILEAETRNILIILFINLTN